MFDDTRATSVSRILSVPFWTALAATSRATLAALFGSDLKADGKTMAVATGRGTRSLGCLNPAAAPTLEVNGYGKLRMHLASDGLNLNLSVTDLRFYRGDAFSALRMAEVQRVQADLERGDEVILALGLTRAWAKPPSTVRKHWLQVNNIHLRRALMWRAD